ncbi:M23 family metallopeptidase [Agrococcus terreus]|uniref:M23 family metallopeptidase n=1 Tax=Agrococcus terreus TaxID=574649 RepID=UPI00384C018F
MAFPVRREDAYLRRGFNRLLHGGVDLTPKKSGTRLPCFAVGKGTVVGIGLGGWKAGKNVMLQLDGDGSRWWYAHLSRIDVEVGDRLIDGAPLGLIGSTGFSTGVHLHLERHWPDIDDETDPWPFIKNEPNAVKPVAPKPAPKPAPALVRVGSRIKLATPWVRYTYSSLSGKMRNNLPAGIYRVAGIAGGNLRLQGNGYDGWVHGSAGAGLL